MKESFRSLPLAFCSFRGKGNFISARRYNRLCDDGLHEGVSTPQNGACSVPCLSFRRTLHLRNYRMRQIIASEEPWGGEPSAF